MNDNCICLDKVKPLIITRLIAHAFDCPLNGRMGQCAEGKCFHLDEAIKLGAYRRKEYRAMKQPVSEYLKGFEEGIVWYQEKLKELI